MEKVKGSEYLPNALYMSQTGLVWYKKPPSVTKSCVAHLVKHGACNVKVVGSIPMGDQYKKSTEMYTVCLLS